MEVITDKIVLANLSENAKALMADQGLSYRQLAAKIHENHVSIFHAMNGTHEPGIGIIAKIAEGLGVTIDRLLAAPKKSPKNSSRGS